MATIEADNEFAAGIGLYRGLGSAVSAEEYRRFQEVRAEVGARRRGLPWCERIFVDSTYPWTDFVKDAGTSIMGSQILIRCTRGIGFVGKRIRR